MLQKQSRVHVIDNSGAIWVQIFHLYQGFHRKSTGVNLYVKTAAKIVKPPKIEYKGYKRKPVLRGHVNRVILIRSKFPAFFPDKSLCMFFDNAGFLIKRRNQPRSAHFTGAISKKFNRKTFAQLFTDVV